MNDYISRNVITQMLNTMDRYVADELTLCDTDKKFPHNEVFIVDDVYEEIVEQLPPADVRENIHGEWIKMGQGYVCSRCSTTCAVTEMADAWIWHTNDRFCRGCGADMRGNT